MGTDAKLKQRGIMKISKEVKFYSLCTAVIFSMPFFSANIFYHDIDKHAVEIQEKSPLFPYAKYDYMTTEDTFFEIDGKLDAVPAFFRTDFASIPKIFWIVDAPYKASFVYPAIWHDFNYTCPGKSSRKQIDDIFYSLLRAEGNSVITSLKIYIAVRLFGGSHFASNESCKEYLIQKEQDKNYYDEENPNG